MDQRKSILATILLSATLTIMAGSIIAPIQNLIRDGLNVHPSWVGLIITTHGLFMALFSPLMGSIIDRKGTKGVFTASLICYGLAGGAGLLIPTFTLLLVSRALLGIALAGIFTSINVLILNLFEKSDRDRVMGWRGSAQSMGGIAWPLAGGFLGSVSWHLPFGIYMIAIPIGFAAIFTIPAGSQSSPPSTPSNEAPSVFSLIRQVSVLPVIMAMSFSGSVLLYAIVIFLPQRLEQFSITSSMIISLFIVTMTASSAIVSFFYGRIRERFSYQTLLVFGTSLWALAFTILSLANNPTLAAIGGAVFGFSQGLIMPTIMAWIGDIVPIEFRGRISSYLGTTGFIGQFAAPYLFAPVVILGSVRNVFVGGLGLAVLWLLFFLFFFTRPVER